MNRYAVALVSLLAVVALAGCGGLGGSGTPTQSPANGTNTPDSTTETPGPYDLPLNGTVLTERHREAIDGAETFRYRQNTTVRAVESSQLLQYRNVSAAVNRGTGVYHATENTTTNPVTDIYVGPNGTALLRQRIGDRTAYDRQRRDPGGSDPYAFPPIGRYLDGLNYSYAGSEQDDGTAVHVYEASGLDALDPDDHGLTALEPRNLSTVSAALRVTDGGRIEAFRYSVVGTNRYGDRIRFTVSLDYAAVGATTVTEPEWTAEAERVTS